MPESWKQDSGESEAKRGRGSIVLGCDPEIALLNRWGVTIASERVLDDPDGDARVGVDGAGVSAELRPGVSLTPVGLAARCLDALVELRQALATQEEVVRVVGGSYAEPSVPLGGHIHIGLGEAEGQEAATNGLLLARWADRLASDWWRQVEVQDAWGRRVECGYGKLGVAGWRPQEYGWEYRTLGSWLAHPSLAVASISLVRLAAEMALIQGVPRVPLTWTSAVAACEKKLAGSGSTPPSRVWESCKQGVKLASKLAARGAHDFRGQDVLKAWGLPELRHV